jgi:Lrp/AsnC family transcriptional regulator, leucine-responsive regulatory protein
MLKLDLRDKKILYELDCDARTPNTIIGKKVGLSAEVVGYRIKRLEEEGIISHYQTIVNISKFASINFKVYINFSHINSEELSKRIIELKKIEEAKWIVTTQGSWDMIITFETSSLEKANILKQSVQNLFFSLIERLETTFIVEAHTFPRRYLVDKKLEDRRLLLKSGTPIKLDEIELKILHLISGNARMPLIEIASKLKTTARNIHYHLQQLEKKEVIMGYKVALDYEKIGILFYKTFVTVDNPEESRLKSLKGFLQAQKNIVHTVTVFGNWDLEPEFEVYSQKEFDNILTKMKDEYSDIIKNINIITITKEHKFVYF